MARIVAIHQPHYLPWQGYIDKLDTADVFVVLDCVQYEKGGWQNRNRVKIPDGAHWLTVPVKKNGGMQFINCRISGNRNIINCTARSCQI